MKNVGNLIFWVIISCLWIGCSSDEPDPDPCASPPQITNIAVTEASCGTDNGSLLVTASGGSGGLMFSLNGASFQQSNQFDNLAAATYSLRVQDTRGCLLEQQVVVEENNTLDVAVSIRADAGCETAQGSVAISGSGGVGDYTYSLDGTSFHTSALFANLAAGDYTAYIKDAENCVNSTRFNLLSGIGFEANIQAIIASNCAISGCHVSGTGRANFTEFSQIKSNASTIKSHTQNKVMPPADSGRELTDDEIAAIACWVDDGALQN